MNILDNIELFFKTHQLDDLTKIRYIYLYICDLFSYDTRFMFAAPRMKEEIYYKEIDVKRVEDFEIVCYGYAKVLQQVLDYFGYQNDIVKETDKRTSTPHVYVTVNLEGRLIKLDPTKKHDTTRIKMPLNTYDFVPLSDDSTFEEDLDYSDDLLKHYNIPQLNEAKKNNIDLIMTYIKSLDQLNDNYPPRDKFFNKFNALVALVNMRQDLNRYDDMDYYFSYLLKRFKINGRGTRGTIIKPAVFFNVDDPTMKDLINIILIEMDNYPPVFYVMEKVDGFYRTNPKEPAEVEKIMEQYSNFMIDEYWKDAVKRAKKTKIL
jgi:hypothetical protein